MKIREIAVISGKGGTGKTTLTASLIPYMENTVLADCDVDAPDLHILLDPQQKGIEEFSGSQKAYIQGDLCINCGLCSEHCKFGAILEGEPAAVNPMKCEGCGVCHYVCSVDAVKMEDARTGEVFTGDTDYGPMIHARLVPGEETSGKLVSRVRALASEKAVEKGWNRVLIDGSPGIGCNVISSVTGADTVLIVTEPSRSGLHDLKRVLDVVERFSGRAFVVINKYDLSTGMSEEIEASAAERNVPVALKIPFDRKIVEAVTAKKIPSIAEQDFFMEQGWGNFIEKITGQG